MNNSALTAAAGAELHAHRRAQALYTAVGTSAPDNSFSHQDIYRAHLLAGTLVRAVSLFKGTQQGEGHQCPGISHSLEGRGWNRCVCGLACRRRLSPPALGSVMCPLTRPEACPLSQELGLE